MFQLDGDPLLYLNDIHEGLIDVAYITKISGNLFSLSWFMNDDEGGIDRASMTDKLSPIHPGEVLLEEFIKPMKLSQNRLAIEIGVDARRINEIVLGKRSITADTALRLARFFGNSPRFWLGLQSQYDLDVTQDHLGKRLDREVRPLETAG
jgi:antitoxin HigA-1